ncbi:MAG: nucleoside triphosphate pyrophosphohydrolase [Thermodesulfobacteriota bacterium]
MPEQLENLITVIDELLGPDGCPWDKEQTPQSLCDYLLEETFELISAIRTADTQDIKEEMGDVFFLLLFIARLYSEKFTLDEVWKKNAEKMIGRHPHVFGQTKLNSQEELFSNWEKIKRQEKSDGKKSEGTFDSLPAALPPLLKAYRINSKAARNGFTWTDDKGVGEKLAEEWAEWNQAVSEGNIAQSEEEFGDYLFTLAEFARRHKIKPNTALDKANHKFLERFKSMENLAFQEGKALKDLDMTEKQRLWKKIKATEKQL